MRAEYADPTQYIKGLICPSSFVLQIDKTHNSTFLLSLYGNPPNNLRPATGNVSGSAFVMDITWLSDTLFTYNY